MKLSSKRSQTQNCPDLFVTVGGRGTQQFGGELCREIVSYLLAYPSRIMSSTNPKWLQLSDKVSVGAMPSYPLLHAVAVITLATEEHKSLFRLRTE